MAKIYYNRLLVGTITYDKIHPKYQEQVFEYGKADLEAGKMTEEKFNELFGVTE